MQLTNIKTKISSLLGMEMWEIITSITVILSIASILLWMGTLRPSAVHASTMQANQVKVDAFNAFVESDLVATEVFLECTDNLEQDFLNLHSSQEDIGILGQYVAMIDETTINYEEELASKQIEYQTELSDFVTAVRDFILLKKSVLENQYTKNEARLDSCLVEEVPDNTDVVVEIDSHKQKVFDELEELEVVEQELVGNNRGYKDVVYLGIK